MKELDDKRNMYVRYETWIIIIWIGNFGCADWIVSNLARREQDNLIDSQCEKCGLKAESERVCEKWIIEYYANWKGRCA